MTTINRNATVIERSVFKGTVFKTPVFKVPVLKASLLKGSVPKAPVLKGSVLKGTVFEPLWPSLPRFIALTLMIVITSSCAEPDPAKTTLNTDQPVRPSYPTTRASDHEDTYFGETIQDPYRWLEDDRSAETADWVADQNQVTQAYLSQIAYRDQIKTALTELWHYPRISAPFKEGDWVYFYQNTGLQNHSVLMRQQLGQSPEVFLDANLLSDNGTVSIGQVSFSKSARLSAYTQSIAGSDWRSIHILDVTTQKALEPPLQNVKFSGITWLADTGFFYSSYQKPDGSERTAQVDDHRLYFHRLGTPQQNDELIYGGPGDEKRRYVGADLTEDQRYLSIQTAQTTAGNTLLVKDLSKPDSAFILIPTEEHADTRVVKSLGETLLLFTNQGAPNGRLVAMTLDQPEPAAWTDVIPERELPLRISTGAGYLFAHYLIDARSRLYQYTDTGDLVREIPLPEPGSASRPFGKDQDETLYYTFSNYKQPSTIYAFDPASGQSRRYFKPEIRFNSDDFETHQVFYSSTDGTQVPMTITHQKGLKRDGNNPTLLYGYGGFDISITPSFSTTTALWLSLGGIYAVPNIRGGGEYGKHWHIQGTRHQKQNVFDDFIAAAQYLIDAQYTRPDYLAISGRSNGGLLVGAVMTQRPDLMKVALPGVGVLDMLRYHTFTAGAGWSFDYGRSDESREMFETLLGYSPLHNLKPGAQYPATLITTADHDDRVVPAHSFKFAATLQGAQSGPAPTLIRIETDAGHGAGTSIEKRINQTADTLSFTLFNLGISSLEIPHDE